MPDPRPPAGYHLARFFFVKLLGLTFLVAFLSAWAQMPGLVGSHGLLPAGQMISESTRLLPEAWKRVWIFPTFSWVSPSDFSLGLQCGLGVLASLGVLAGLAPALLLLAAWALYLSVCVSGQVFYNYQWDNLLLELGLLAALTTPWVKTWFRPDPAKDPAPGRWTLVLFLGVLFKLMFFSGLVKLASQDASWTSLTALTFHYWTQPLPNPLSWWFARLPLGVLRGFALFMFFVELGIPLMFFLPARFRRLAFGWMVALQVGILAAGNYGFFNFLSIFLCLWVLDDAAWPERLKRRIGFGEPATGGPALPKTQRNVLALYGFLTGLVAVRIFFGFMGFQPLGTPGGWVHRALYPFRSFNSYGLFAVMTKERPEIVVEGSVDGKTWREIPFRYKPGDPLRRPPQIAPYMPRLDWQMWFAALGDCESSPFLSQLGAAILSGDPQVLALLGPNPFPEGPPKAVRFKLYNYRMTDGKSRRDTGAYWTREYARDFCPELAPPK